MLSLLQFSVEILLIRITFILIFLSNGISQFIPTIQTQYQEYETLILSNYINNHKECKINTFSDNLDLEIKSDTLLLLQKNTFNGLELIELRCSEQYYKIPVKKRSSEDIRFNYFSNNQELSVFVMGNFNDWSRTSHPMKYSNGKYESIINFTTGKYEYKFVINGDEVLDKNNRDSIPNGLGGWNNTFEIKEEKINFPGKIIKSEVNDDTAQVILKFKFNKNQNNERLNINKTFVLLNNSVLNQKYLRFTGNYLYITLSKNFNGRLRIIGENNFGQSLLENHTIIKNGYPINPEKNLNNFHFTVIYSLMIDRFYNGSRKNDNPFKNEYLEDLGNYKGGDIAGIIRKLKEGYFSNLGVNMLWISPVLKGPSTPHVESVPPFRTYSGYHGYWPTSNTEIEPRFGGRDDLKKMVEIAHENKIKVIIDFVSNHVHEDHPYAIQYPSWFSEYELPNGDKNLRKWDGETRLTTWFEKFLPTFDYSSNPAAIEAVVSDAINFLKDYNIDGFRQDATKHVSHQFWKSLTKKIKKTFPEKDIFQIGETFGSDELILSYVNPAELNSQFNFNIYFNARSLFVDLNSSFISFNQVVEDVLNTYQPINLMGTITSSHDQVRFMAFADEQINFHENGVERSFNNLPTEVNNKSSYDKLFGFTAMNMSLPGIPVIYYGEEYGQIGANDPGNRLNMRFQFNWNDSERELNKKIKQLINLRKSNPAFALGDLEFLYNSRNVSVWKKSYFGDEVLILFNISDKSELIKLNLDDYKILKSQLGNSEILLKKSKINILLKPNETRIYKLIK
ncbi:MAG: hypothetical protein CMF96_00865 [Candidatus Marinimicrobia bacterium]|nr:hypothetical protein [Candidatus Neomarinimicrobiota bacterium]